MNNKRVKTQTRTKEGNKRVMTEQNNNKQRQLQNDVSDFKFHDDTPTEFQKLVRTYTWLENCAHYIGHPVRPPQSFSATTVS